jgi:hypothetical protein
MNPLKQPDTVGLTKLTFVQYLISLSVAYKKSSIINTCIEKFLGFNLYFCSKEIVKNNLGLEKC